MKNILLMILLLAAVSMAAKITIFTEKRIYGISSDLEFTETDSSVEDKSRWEVDMDANCFVHNTNTGNVKQSTYWIDKSTIEDTDSGFTCMATSDADITRRFYFLSNVVIIILESYETGNTFCQIFPIKNIKFK